MYRYRVFIALAATMLLGDAEGSELSFYANANANPYTHSNQCHDDQAHRHHHAGEPFFR